MCQMCESASPWPPLNTAEALLRAMTPVEHDQIILLNDVLQFARHSEDHITNAAVGIVVKSHRYHPKKYSLAMFEWPGNGRIEEGITYTTIVLEGIATTDAYVQALIDNISKLLPADKNDPYEHCTLQILPDVPVGACISVAQMYIDYLERVRDRMPILMAGLKAD